MDKLSAILCSGYSKVSNCIDRLNSNFIKSNSNNRSNKDKIEKIVYIVFWDTYAGFGIAQNVGFAIGDSLVKYRIEEEIPTVYKYDPLKKTRTSSLFWPIVTSEKRYKLLLNEVKNNPEGLASGISCISQTCYVFKKFGILDIPYPITEMPVLLMSYLTISSKITCPQEAVENKTDLELTFRSMCYKLSRLGQNILGSFLHKNIKPLEGNKLSQYTINSTAIKIEVIVLAIMTQFILDYPICSGILVSLYGLSQLSDNERNFIDILKGKVKIVNKKFRYAFSLN